MNYAKAQDPHFATLPYSRDSSDLMDNLSEKGAHDLTLTDYFPSPAYRRATNLIFILSHGERQVVQLCPRLSNKFIPGEMPASLSEERLPFWLHSILAPSHFAFAPWGSWRRPNDGPGPHSLWTENKRLCPWN